MVTKSERNENRKKKKIKKEANRGCSLILLPGTHGLDIKCYGICYYYYYWFATFHYGLVWVLGVLPL